jgi:DNA-binding protein Fis
MSGVDIAKIKKADRDRTITYLQESAKGTPIEDFVNAILRRYKEEVDLFIYNDTDDLYNRVTTETQQPFLTYLNIVIHPSGKRTKDGIIESITGVAWQPN